MDSDIALLMAIISYTEYTHSFDSVTTVVSDLSIPFLIKCLS